MLLLGEGMSLGVSRTRLRVVLILGFKGSYVVNLCVCVGGGPLSSLKPEIIPSPPNVPGNEKKENELVFPKRVNLKNGESILDSILHWIQRVKGETESGVPTKLPWIVDIERRDGCQFQR
jgi:hypothetical protein